MNKVTFDQPGSVREGEQLNLNRLQRYLSDQLDVGGFSLQVKQFLSGYSNLTYLLRIGSRKFVLRRPPFGNQVKSAHDMSREYRVLSQLCQIYEPAPRPILYCQDPEVIGAEFYLMERCHGVVLRGPDAPEPLNSNPQLVRQLCESFVDNLARLHTLDYETAGLGHLGKPTGYVDRQVTGWTKRYVKAQTSEVPEMDRLAMWLDRNRPANTRAALIHNDYKYDNLMLDLDDMTRIMAVLDWEMSTVGDPLMDLGMTLAYWIEPSDVESLRTRAFGPTMAPGSLTRRELVLRYCAQTGWEIENPLFYYCFGLFKLAVIVQQIYTRYAHGHTRDPRFAELDNTVRTLGKAAEEAISRGVVSSE